MSGLLRIILYGHLKKTEGQAMGESKMGDSVPEHYASKHPEHAEASTGSLSSISGEGIRARPKDANCAFDATEDPRYYKPIPTYEGIHRWDPEFEWSEQEEKRIIRKVGHIRFIFAHLQNTDRRD